MDVNPRAETNTPIITASRYRARASPLCHRLGADKRHRSAPIIEPQLTQRADLELIGSGRRESSQDELARASQRERGRRTGRYAVNHQGITEFVSDCSGQSSNLLRVERHAAGFPVSRWKAIVEPFFQECRLCVTVLNIQFIFN